MAHKVFISYAAEDKQIADAVCETLEAREIKCWYAPRDVPYGQDFDEAIVDAICASRLMILVLSSHSNQSAHVKREIQNACMDDAAVPVLPFRVDDVPLNKALRYYIGAVHWLDAVTPPFESHLDNLVQHVVARLPRTAQLPALDEPEALDSSTATPDAAPKPEVPHAPDTEKPESQFEASAAQENLESTPPEDDTRSTPEDAEKAARDQPALSGRKDETPVSGDTSKAQSNAPARERSDVIIVCGLTIILIGSVLVTVIANSGLPLLFGLAGWPFFFLYLYLREKNSR